MKQFKLTIKRLDSSDEFLELSNKIMKCLYKDFDFRDEPDFCNMTLRDLLCDDLKDLTLKVLGSDWPGLISVLESLILVGSEYGGVNDYACPECGYPEYYYTGGRMLCLQCEHSEEAPENYLNGDIVDYSGFVNLR